MVVVVYTPEILKTVLLCLLFTALLLLLSKYCCLHSPATPHHSSHPHLNVQKTVELWAQK